jgi:starch synthase
LQDTIVDVTSSEEKGTGFLFYPATSVAFVETLQRAFDVFLDKALWKTIQKQGMRRDFSWENSAIQYVKLYQGLLQGLARKDVQVSR